MTRQQREVACLWSLSQKEHLENMKNAARRLNLHELVTTLHLCRHCGASRDVLLKKRWRGRWGSLSSVKIYEAHGRLQEVLSLIGQDIALRGKRARELFSQRFLE